jgi:ribonuclease Z
MRPGMYLHPYCIPQLTYLRSSRKHLADMCVASGITHFQTVEANHGCRCLGCVLRHKDGWSLAYSGDTRPTQALIEAGKDATVLIHEATMNDEDIGLAKVKKHSTIGEAIGVGAR